MHRNHRYLRFGLRAFLVSLTAGCVWLGLIANRVREKREATQWIEGLGGRILYDYQLDDDLTSIKNPNPPGPDWLSQLVGDDCFSDVVFVSIRSNKLTDITPLTNLKHLRVVYLRSSLAIDLTPLRELNGLEWLMVDANVSHSDFEKLKNALPGCRIYRSWSTTKRHRID